MWIIINENRLKKEKNNERLRVICATWHSGEKVFYGHSIFPSYWLSKVKALCSKRKNDLSKIYVVNVQIIEINMFFSTQKKQH